MKKLVRQFADLASFNATEKTALSVRDGVLEYLGEELGLEPADKVFTVYRSPATIANAAMKMAGIPLTDDHVPLNVPAPTGAGHVTHADMVDASDPDTCTTILIRNKLQISDAILPLIETGKRQLSLGYDAGLIEHDTHDFEQVDIQPHHLAAVQFGRCGELCSFIDRNPEGKTMKFRDKLKSKVARTAFCDEEGELNMQSVVELAQSFPEAIKTMPLDKIKEIMPMLQEVMGAAKEAGVEPEPTEDEATEEQEATDTDEVEQEATDEGDGEDKDEKPKFSDAAFKAKLKTEARKFADAEIARRDGVIEKARSFVDEAYSFKGKSTDKIMLDALATEYPGQQFKDTEIAFDMLKKSAPDYSRFGDTSPNHFAYLADKEL